MKITSLEQYYPLPPWTLLICTPVIIWPNLKISDMIWQIVWSRLADHYLCSSRDRADLYLRVNLFLRRKCGILSNVWTWWGPSFSIYSINYRRLADFTFVRTFVHNHHWSWHGLALVSGMLTLGNGDNVRLGGATPGLPAGMLTDGSEVPALNVLLAFPLEHPHQHEHVHQHYL